ncbi:hypothetical protein LJR220_003756 [Bradyrhizobium sp. LjRoot220]
MFAFARCRRLQAAEGRRELASWLRRKKVGKAVMEASGGAAGAVGQGAA